MRAKPKIYVTKANFLAVEIKLEPESEEDDDLLGIMYTLGHGWGNSIEKNKGELFKKLPGITIMACAPLPGARKET